MEWQENKMCIDSIAYRFIKITFKCPLIGHNEQFTFSIYSVNGLVPTELNQIPGLNDDPSFCRQALNGLYRSMIYDESSYINRKTYDSAVGKLLKVKIPNSSSIGLDKWGFHVIAKWGLLIERTKAEVGP